MPKSPKQPKEIIEDAPRVTKVSKIYEETRQQLRVLSALTGRHMAAILADLVADEYRKHFPA